MCVGGGGGVQIACKSGNWKLNLIATIACVFCSVLFDMYFFCTNDKKYRNKNDKLPYRSSANIFTKRIIPNMKSIAGVWYSNGNNH